MQRRIPGTFDLKWNVRVPMRDGCHLGATVYTPHQQVMPAPAVVMLTPYTVDRMHDRASYFASRGLPVVCVDVRGRGNSDEQFRPYIHDARDGYDIVEWVARQSFCNGKVGMYGASYLGYVQWVIAAQLPPHLCTIAPTAAPCMGVDVPNRNNIFGSYFIRWLSTVTGRNFQEKIFSDNGYWRTVLRRQHETGTPFRRLDSNAGLPSDVFQEWLDHPEQDDYWDSFNPSQEDYRKMQLPVLTVTGVYDGDQLGALAHYQRHTQNAPSAARTQHYLVIGPWNHAGCTYTSDEVDGVKLGPAAVVDMLALHLEWYEWTMGAGTRPEFLRDRVAYYVMGADCWCYAPSLESITSRYRSLYLQSSGNPTDVFRSGLLIEEGPGIGGPDDYEYDPRDCSLAELESTVDENDLTDQRMVYARGDRSVIYHSLPLAEDIEVSGFFKLTAWIGINQPDTDFRVSVYEIGVDGSSILLTTDTMRARYRGGLREPQLIRTEEPLRYDFERFTFVSRWMRKASRLRLVLDSNSSIHEQKNFNSGGIVAQESMSDARPVTVRLFHSAEYESALYVPVGRGELPNTAESGEP